MYVFRFQAKIKMIDFQLNRLTRPHRVTHQKKKSIEYYENFIIFVGHVIINFNAINQSRTTAIENNI